MILIYVENSIKRIDKKYWEFRDNYILDFSNYNNSTSHIEIHHLDNISVDAIDKLFKIVNLDNLFYSIIKADLYNSEKEIIDGIMSGVLLANTVINIIDTNQLTTSTDIIKGNMISAQKRFYKNYKSNRIISETIYNNIFSDGSFYNWRDEKRTNFNDYHFGDKIKFIDDKDELSIGYIYSRYFNPYTKNQLYYIISYNQSINGYWFNDTSIPINDIIELIAKNDPIIYNIIDSMDLDDDLKNEILNNTF